MYNYLCVHVQVGNLYTEPLIATILDKTVEIVLLSRKVDMMGKTFSSSFVRDCRFTGGIVVGSGINLPVSIHSLIKGNHRDNVCFIEKMRKREQILMGVLVR